MWLNKIFLLLFFLGPSPQGHDLQVEISNINEGRGTIRVALYQDEEHYMKTPFRTASTPAVKGTVSVSFRDLPPGTYAISVMHDADDNEKLNSNFVGMPKEGFGFSNDAIGSFGPPSFEKARFAIPAKGQSIHLKYL